MREKIIFLFLFVFLIIISGCTVPTRTKGREISTNSISNIIIGKTSKDQVSLLVGNPDSYQSDINGNETWIYSYITQQRTIGITGLTQSVERTEKGIRVTFSKNNIVSDCIYGTYSNVGTPNKSPGEVAAGIGNKTTRRCQDVKY